MFLLHPSPYNHMNLTNNSKKIKNKCFFFSNSTNEGRKITKGNFF